MARLCKSQTDDATCIVGGEIKKAVLICLSAVADRNGTERTLRVDDLMKAIQDVHRAKKDIGRYDYDR